MDLKTANTPKHNYNKNFKKYIRTKSTRSIENALRTKRFDVGYFFLEFYPLVRDMFLVKHPNVSEHDFEMLLQLHANQPFDNDDMYDCTMKKRSMHDGNWKKKTKISRRLVVKLLYEWQRDGIIESFKNAGRYNKHLYVFTYDFETKFKRIYDYILCTSKIRTSDHEVVVPAMKDSKSHYKRMIKQNSYYDKFDAPIELQLRTPNSEFSIRLNSIRAKTKDS